MRSTIYSVPTQALLVHFLSQQGCATSITESGVKARQGVSSSEAAGPQLPELMHLITVLPPFDPRDLFLSSILNE